MNIVYIGEAGNGGFEKIDEPITLEYMWYLLLCCHGHSQSLVVEEEAEGLCSIII